MTAKEAREYMVNAIKNLIDNKDAYICTQNPAYIDGQAVGMVRAFQAMGVITREENREILSELLDMI